MNAKSFASAFAAMLFACVPVLLAADDAETTTDVKAKDNVLRSSVIDGMTVKNAEDEDLGEVTDIVIDVTSGDVHYLAVSYGGFLGLGDKLFAVPVDAFRLTRGEDANEYYLTLPVDEKTLKSAPGFDQDNWPDFADKSWDEKINKHYENYLHHPQADDAADIDVQAGDVDVAIDLNRDDASDRVLDRKGDANRDRAEGAQTTTAENTIHRVSELTGMAIMNQSNEEIGEVYDFVVDLTKGKVNYIAMSRGGVLGIGDKLFAIPFDEIDCRRGEDGEYFLVVKMDEKSLENNPGFDQENWPDFAAQ